MAFLQSHGRLGRKYGRILIGVCVAVLGSGVVFAALLGSVGTDNQRKQNIQNVEQRARLIEADLDSASEYLRSQLQLVSKWVDYARDKRLPVDPALLDSTPFVMWSEGMIQDGNIKSNLFSFMAPKWKIDAQNSLADSVFSQVQGRLKADLLRKPGSIQLIPLGNSFAGATQGLNGYIAWVTVLTRDRYTMGVSETQKTFPQFQKLGARNRVFLLAPNGRALLHAQSPWSGVDYSGTEIYRKGALKLFNGAKDSIFGDFKSADQKQMSTHLSYWRNGGLTLVIESDPVHGWTSLPGLKSLFVTSNGRSVLWGGLILFLVFGMLTYSGFLILSREVEKDFPVEIPEVTREMRVFHLNRVDLDSTAEELKTAEIEITGRLDPLPHLPAFNIFESETDRNEDTREMFKDGPQTALTQNTVMAESRPEGEVELEGASEVPCIDHPAEFEEEVLKTTDPLRAMATLAGRAAKLCESPVLVFEYSDSTQSCQLRAAAGFEKRIVPFTFAIRRDIEEKVLELSRRGRIAALNRYGVLEKQIATRIGVEHFEAWAYTSTEERDPKGPRWLGLVVVLKPGFQGAIERPALARMLRIMGAKHYDLLKNAEDPRRTGPSNSGNLQGLGA